jgi:hypothetical protein
MTDIETLERALRTLIGFDDTMDDCADAITEIDAFILEIKFALLLAKKLQDGSVSEGMELASIEAGLGVLGALPYRKMTRALIEETRKEIENDTQ